ncbi:MAG: VPLPA-CTERM sorting domain-containing protein [Sulfuricaulis sp.]
MKKNNSSTTATRRRPIIVSAMGLMAVASPMFAVNAYAANTDVAYVENALKNAPVALYSFGTVTATSVSPCFSVGCQNTSGNPLTTSSSSNSSVGGIGSAKASSDLSTGILGAYAQELGTTGSSAAAGAGFWDTLTFSGSGSGSVALMFTVPGTFTDVGYGGACEGYNLIGGTFGSGSTCGASTGSDPFGSSATVLNSGNQSETLTLNVPLENGVPTRVAFALGAAANNSFNPATADAYDPPTVSMGALPAGWSYNGSASGVFLTGPAPVPLPAAVWMFGSGLAGLFGFARRKKVSAS